MSTETIVIVRDDLDGTEGAVPVKFSIGGKSYVIDLVSKNHDKLIRALAPFVEKGRRDTALMGPGASKVIQINRAYKYKAGVDFDATALKAWAAEQGIRVAQKGAIAADVVEKFLAETGARS